MATLNITETHDYRNQAVTAFGGIDRLRYSLTESVPIIATFSSSQFANGRSVFEFSGILDTVVIEGRFDEGIPTIHGITVVLSSGATSFSADGWGFTTPMLGIDVILIGGTGNDTLT